MTTASQHKAFALVMTFSSRSAVLKLKELGQMTPTHSYILTLRDFNITMGTTTTFATATVQVKGSIIHNVKLLILVLLLAALDVQSFSPQVPSFLRRILKANDNVVVGRYYRNDNNSDHVSNGGSTFKVQVQAPKHVGSKAGRGSNSPDSPTLEVLVTDGKETGAKAAVVDGIPFFMSRSVSNMNVDLASDTSTTTDSNGREIAKHHVEAMMTNLRKFLSRHQEEALAPLPPALEAEDPWSEHTVVVLKKELKYRGLHVSGSKPILVAKLIESDAKMEIYEREKLQRAAARFVNDSVIKPFFSKEFKKGVSGKTITGAAVSAALFALVTGGNSFFAGVAGIVAAYMAISPGVAGNTVRWFGKKAVAVAFAVVRTAFSETREEKSKYIQYKRDS